MKKLGLYVHIPFCVRKCNYCDFYSVAHSCDTEKSYITALCDHIRAESHLYKNCEFDTVYIGGGTPSILSPESIKMLADTIKNNLKTTQGLEFSIELNPCSITEEKLLAYKSVGINRLSIGMQSASDSELKRLGRLHTRAELEKGFLLARECGFDNISLDLMFGLPSQSIDNFAKTVDYALALSPEHISAYGLKIEENTPFGRNINSLSLPTEDEDYEMYKLLCHKLSKVGYEQYEISNFAKEGYRSRHNMKYWLCQEYVGFGPAAHSYFDGVRYCYERDLQKYISGKWGKITEDYEREHQTQEDKMDEYVMLRLRLCDGVDEKEFEKAFQKQFLSEYPKIESFVKSGHVSHKNSKFAFTTDGFFVSNYILSKILH